MELLLVKKAKYLNNYRIELTFNNGEVKTVDLSNKLDKPVFTSLKKISVFKKFRINPFTLEWENGADFAPEYLYRLAIEQENKTTPINQKNSSSIKISSTNPI